MTPGPSWGEVWDVDLGMPIGHEQGLRRPALVVSDNSLNHGPTRLVVIVPLTTRQRRLPLRVPVVPPEGGVRQPSDIMCDQIRTISHDRLITRWGSISPATMTAVAIRLRPLLRL